MCKRAPSFLRRRTDEPTVAEGEHLLLVDDLCIDLARREVRQANRPLAVERGLLFDLLAYLVQHRGRVLTKEQLLAHVWGCEHEQAQASTTRTIAVHIHWLRTLLGDDATQQRWIQTVHGVGYRFTDGMLVSRTNKG